MPGYFEKIGACSPFDDPDAVRNCGVGASPARSWQHGVARAIMAYLIDALGKGCVLNAYPLAQRSALVSDLERIIDTYEDDQAGVIDRVFDRIFSDYAVEQDIRQGRTHQNVLQMMDECYQLIDGNHQPLKRLAQHL